MISLKSLLLPSQYIVATQRQGDPAGGTETVQAFTVGFHGVQSIRAFSEGIVITRSDEQSDLVYAHGVIGVLASTTHTQPYSDMSAKTAGPLFEETAPPPKERETTVAPPSRRKVGR